MKNKIPQAIRRIIAIRWLLLSLGWIWSSVAFAEAGVPNGTWLSQPQIRYHSSSNTLDKVMNDMRNQQYRVLFLDFRGVSNDLQQIITDKARSYRLIPVVWIQSPQHRSLTVSQLIHEARHGDGIQIDDHFFANYSKYDFQSLSYYYRKPIFCSIQPFQAHLLSGGRCNQLDVQCYTPSPSKFNDCLKLADDLNAVVSLSDKRTFRYREKLGYRRFNVFLWPYSLRHR